MPCDYKHYPADWPAIRARILEREENRCLWCGVANYSLCGTEKIVRVVLTVAHLDHDRENNTDANLAALCQKCHLGHDLKLHMRHARETRERKVGQLTFGIDET
jgi:5-methylcytosine-specific restriction endonuclease McrA